MVVTKGLLCREFGWTLTELREQPVDETFQVWSALKFFESQIEKVKSRRFGKG